MQENNQAPTPEITTPVVEQPKQNNFLVILLSVLLFLSVSIAGFFAYQTQMLVKELTMLKTEEKVVDTSEPTTQPDATESSEVDPTADWKTYTGKLFSFKYPKDAKLEVQPDGVVKIMYMGQKQIDSGRTQTSLFDGYGFFVAPSKEKVSLEDGYKNRVESFNNVCDSEKMGKSKITKIDGFQALQYDSSCLGDYTTSLVINKDNIFFELSQLYVGETADQSDYKKITDQILSTLKFLN